MEQAGVRYLVGFRLELNDGSSLVSPIRVCDDEDGAKKVVLENVEAMQKAGPPQMDFVDFLGIAKIEVVRVTLPGDDIKRIVKPSLILAP